MGLSEAKRLVRCMIARPCLQLGSKSLLEHLCESLTRKRDSGTEEWWTRDANRMKSISFEEFFFFST